MATINLLYPDYEAGELVWATQLSDNTLAGIAKVRLEPTKGRHVYVGYVESPGTYRPCVFLCVSLTPRHAREQLMRWWEVAERARRTARGNAVQWGCN